MALVLLAAGLLASTSMAHTTAQAPDLKALDGEWTFVEDRTEGRTLEQMSPPMSSRFSMKSDGNAVILVSGHGSGHRDVRVALNGSHTDVKGTPEGAFARYKGSWKDGVFTYQTEYSRGPGQELGGLIRREFQITPDGLLVRVSMPASGPGSSVGLYKHAEDIAMPLAAKATIADLGWLVGAWTGTRGTAGTTTIEERWSPARGGSMFAISRTVSRDRLSAFEYLRIVEREGGLVYVAQPNGGPPTEFVMTEFTTSRAVFDNPRHDYPKRIVYELAPDGGLTATIGFLKGGTPRQFAFKKEAGGS